MNFRDEGTVFEIVPYTRKVVVPKMYKVIGTVGEHLAEQLTFKCPKMVDGRDITACSRKYVTWKNIRNEMGHEELCNLTVEGDYAYLTWDVTNGTTAVKGLVSFSVHFADVDEKERMTYHWCTTTCNDCEILDSINALIGVYEKIYVSDEKLVIADYTPVYEEALTLDSGGTVPEGTCIITTNGRHPVGEFATADVQVEAPTETLEITENGPYEVLNYANVNVDVPQPNGACTITNNGDFTVRDYIIANVRVPEPTGTVTVTGNGSWIVKNYEFVDVQVPEPSGEKTIIANGEHDVKNFATARVEVPEPVGYTLIDAYGSYDVDVKSYATARVQLPPPSGKLTIHENGIHNIEEYAQVDVQVSEASGMILIDKAGTYDVNVAPYATARVQIFEPSGTLTITENKDGIDVKNKESVNVRVPFDTPKVSVNPDTGQITATANGKSGSQTLSASIDADFKAENIKAGVKIFGLTGTANVVDTVNVTLQNATGNTKIYVEYGGYDGKFGKITRHKEMLEANKAMTMQVVRNSLFMAYYVEGSQDGASANKSVVLNLTGGCHRTYGSYGNQNHDIFYAEDTGTIKYYSVSNGG